MPISDEHDPAAHARAHRHAGHAPGSVNTGRAPDAGHAAADHETPGRSADAGHADDHETVDAAQHWDDMYGERDQVWSGRVNPVLADRAAQLTPGRALDLGCGEGADAIWLAGRGWSVTAVDVSGVALGRAERHARTAHVADRITFERRDLAEGLPGGPFDLVSAQFLQSPIGLDTGQLLAGAARLLAVGGTLLVVSHAAAPPWARSGHEHTDFPTPESTLAGMRLEPDGWSIDEAAVVGRDATGPDGETGQLLDCVVRVRRIGRIG